MKKLIILSLIMVAGCGSYSESRGLVLDKLVKTVALGEFTGSDVAGVFRQQIQKELSQAGFTIVEDNADVEVTGAVAYVMPGLGGGQSDWVLTCKTKKGIVCVIEYHEGLYGWKCPKEITLGLSERLICELVR
jgi:hypothetical protein